MIRIVLPYHLRNLARVDGEVEIEVAGAATIESALDALEQKYPMLRGAIRDHVTKKRRDFLRFFVCEEDWSHHAPDTPLPDEIISGREPLIVLGAIAGG
jgi:sulfur-carrier protein